MEITTLLEGCDPVASTEMLGPDSALAEKIRRDVVSRRVGERVVRRYMPHQRSVRRFPVVTAVVFALVIALVLTVLSLSERGPLSASPAPVVAALDQLASNASVQPPEARSGGYYYTELEKVELVSGAPTFFAYITATEQDWNS